MAKRWKCARCSTENDEGVLTCSNCRMIRGAVVVPGSYIPPADTPVPAWPAAAETPAPSDGDEPDETSWDAGIDSAGGPSAPIPFWRRIPLQWVILGAVVAVAGIGGLIINASRSASGEITKAGDLTAAELRVGDCFDLKDPAADQIEDVNAVPCADEHEYEMFFVGTMPEGAFPSEEAFSSFVETNCSPAFEAYIGKSFASSELDVSWLFPVEDAWRSGDRSIQCVVYDPQINRLTGSLKGSAR